MYWIKKCKYVLTLLVAVSMLLTAMPCFSVEQNTTDEYELMLNRLVANYTGEDLDLTNPTITAKLERPAKNSKLYLAQLNKQADRTLLWDDIIVKADNSHITSLYTRLNTMAMAYASPGTDMYNNAELGAAILDSMDWIYQNMHSENSLPGTSPWVDSIGIHLEYVKLIALMYKDMSAEQIAACVRTIDRWIPDPTIFWGIEGGGSNMFNQCWIVICRGIFGKTPEKIHLSVASLDKEFDYTDAGSAFNDPNNYAPPESGFYTDGSFIQHWRHPYTGGYGAAVLTNFASIIYLLNDTSFETTDPDVNNVYKWIYDTYMPVMYNGQMMDNVRGRNVSRLSPNPLSVDMIHAFLQVAKFAPPADAEKIKSIVKYWLLLDSDNYFLKDAPMLSYKLVQDLMNDDSVEPVQEIVMHKQFPIMDRVVHHQSDYAFSVSMSSSRIYNYESIGNENMTGWYQGDGMTYLYNEYNPLQYFNYFLYVNPKRLPGTTVDTQNRAAVSIPTGQAYRSSKDWVGGTSIGRYGVSGMWLDAVDSTLEAKKSWFMFDDEVVALGAGINSTDNRNIETIIENRRLFKKNPDAVVDPNIPAPLKIVSVTASADDGNVPANTLDENLNTRWSANGAGQWIQFEFDGEKNIGHMALAYHNGHTSPKKFDIQVSKDGEVWETVYSGQTSGTTSDLEAVDLVDSSGRYLKLIGYGSATSTWNSVTEVAIYEPNPNGLLFRPITLVGYENLVVNGVSKPTDIGWAETMSDVSWINLEGTGGYYFPTPVSVKGLREKRTVNFMNLFMEHGSNPTNATYSYVLLPNKDAAQTSAYTSNPDIQIVQNNEIAQAVKENKLHILGVNFWQAGTVDCIESSNPASVMLEETGNAITLSVSDPTQKQNKVTVKIKNMGIKSVLEANPKAVVTFVADGAIVEFDVSGSHGMAQTISFSANSNSPTLSLSQAEFDKNPDQQSDISVEMTANGMTFNGIAIKDSSNTLVQNPVYTVEGDNVVFGKDFLAALPLGVYTVTFNFGPGNNIDMVLTIIDSTPQSSDFIVNTPVIKNAAGNAVTTMAELANSYSVKAQVSIENISSSSKNAVLVVALYDSNSTMKRRVKSMQVIENQKTVQLTAEFDLPENISGYSLKIFVLDSLDTNGLIHQISNTVTIQ